MIETWLDGSETLVNLGFSGTSGRVVYIPLDFPVSASRLIEDYHSKIIVQYIAPKRTLAIDIPVIERNGRPWGKWRITKQITENGGLLSFQYKAINDCYRLLRSRVYRAVVFDEIAIGDASNSEIRTARRTW